MVDSGLETGDELVASIKVRLRGDVSKQIFVVGMAAFAFWIFRIKSRTAFRPRGQKEQDGVKWIPRTEDPPVSRHSSRARGRSAPESSVGGPEHAPGFESVTGELEHPPSCEPVRLTHCQANGIRRHGIPMEVLCCAECMTSGDISVRLLGDGRWYVSRFQSTRREVDVRPAHGGAYRREISDHVGMEKERLGERVGKPNRLPTWRCAM